MSAPETVVVDGVTWSVTYRARIGLWWVRVYGGEERDGWRWGWDARCHLRKGFVQTDNKWHPTPEEAMRAAAKLLRESDDE